jgi:acetyl-CoA carboxylase carboxyltransferase component
LSNPDQEVYEVRERTRSGGPPDRRAAHEAAGKMFVRDRLDAFFDPGTFVEDYMHARMRDGDKPADAVVTGVGRVAGRLVAVMGNDMTVKAGTWGVKTIEKIMRIQEVALTKRIPIVYFVDSGAARLDEQFDLFLDRSHAGKIFWWMSRMNGVVPQICVNFGPSPAGSAYLPAFCDLVVMIDGQTSVYLGSPRMAAMATGEEVSHEEMGGARMHCEVSGLGDVLVDKDEAAIELVRRYLALLPDNWRGLPPRSEGREPAPGPALHEIVPEDQRKPFDAHHLINGVIDADSWFGIKELFAPELVTGFARLDGHVVGVVASNSKRKGGVLYADSAEKGAQFISTCTAFNVPLLFFMDVPGFMIGSRSERTGIIRRGQKMLQAVAEATQPRICVVVRKGYGAGYMAMSGATFQPDCTLALPTAKLAIMGPEAAVNAIYARKLEAIEDPDERLEFVRQKREEYDANINVWAAASEMYIDDVVPFDELRSQLVARLELYLEHYEVDSVLSPRRSAILRG